MNSHSSPEYTSRSPEYTDEPTTRVIETEQDQPGRLGEAMSQLSRDFGSLTNSFTQLASELGGSGAKTVRNMGQTVASQVGSAASGMADTGSDLASSATEHAKTFASELEGMARRNPLGTIAGALVVGVVIGLMTRGRG
jgi:ElaB/YqjD/DUF883 family membrane-anchored ribosome-binding protein